MEVLGRWKSEWWNMKAAGNKGITMICLPSLLAQMINSKHAVIYLERVILFVASFFGVFIFIKIGVSPENARVAWLLSEAGANVN